MNILRRKLFEAFPDAIFTYGNITNADRKILDLEKTHANDAVAIASHGCGKIKDCEDTVYFRQIHKKKRSLHEAVPRKGCSGPNRHAARNAKNIPCSKGFHLYDKVVDPSGRVGYISGFTGQSAYLVDFTGKYIEPEGKSYRQHNLSGLKFCHQNGNWITTTNKPAVSHD